MKKSALVETLNQEVELLLAGLDANPVAKRMFEGTLERGDYIGFLTETYHYVKFTQPLLARAAERLDELGKQPEMATLFRQKSEEENGHDAWAMHDLKELGCDPEDVVYRTPSAAVQAYIAWNQYMVESDNPTGYLGTAYVLEALSVHRAFKAVDSLKRTKKIPNIDDAVVYLTGHGEADGGHVQALAYMLSKITDPMEIEMIAASARVTRLTYLGLFKTVAALSMSQAA